MVRTLVPLAALASIVLPQHVRAQCENENQCSFKKPNILLLVDYSSSMRGFENGPAYFPPGQTVTTRWDAAMDAASWILRYSDGFFANNARVGLTRFAHDPDLEMSATMVLTDMSFPPIVDGFAIDVPFDGTDGRYFDCKGSGVEAAIEVLRTTPPPPIATSGGVDRVMLTWTRGALQSAGDLIEKTRKNHRSDPGEDKRDYEVVLMTDGDWTCPDRFGQSCPEEDPAPEAERLKAAGVPVHVIAFGDATMQPSLNELALLGGTVKAIDATSPQGIVDAFTTVLDRIRDSVIVPTCTQKLPRMLIVMDASTSMIVGDAPGETKWDKARFALTGNPAAPNPGDPGYVEPVLTRKLKVGGREAAVEDVLHIGMVAFGAADQQKLMASYGPCMRDNIAWAMDPTTSCEAPGCTDPYGGAPLTWTFKNSDVDRQPRFVRTTQSYMPPCNRTPNSDSCTGQTPTTFTGQGLEFAQQAIADYKRNAAPFKLDPSTRFVNVLLTDGQTSEGSSDVQKVLIDMVAAGIDTYVIGFGTGDEIDEAQLNRYAGWGNTKSALVVDPMQPNSVAALADALSGVVTSLGLDSCCVLNRCSAMPEPADPKPVCGDGTVDANETCDEGRDNATYGHCGGDCKSRHLYCGDMHVDLRHEECDDGNTAPGDGCDARCQSEPPDDAGVTGLGGAPAPLGAAGARAGSPADAARPFGPGRFRDAGANASQDSDEDGCGCRLQQRTSSHAAWPACAAVALALLWRRRQRRSRS